MPRYFNKNELTSEQLEHWDSYISMYEKTLSFNVNRELVEMQENKKEQLLEMFGDIGVDKIKEKMLTYAEIMGNTPGHEKSALFFRLMSGKKPLLYRVPLSYSYPDYDIMESENPRELHIDSFKLSELIVNENGIDYITINQCRWKVLSHTENQAQLTYGEWENLGFIWDMELKEIKANVSQKSIIAHHNPALNKITQYDDLLKEVEYQVRNRFKGILMNINVGTAMERKEEYTKYDGFAKTLYEQEMLRGKTLLNERRSNQLSDYPSEEEIAELIKKEVPHYLGTDYYVVGNELYLKTWFMEKVSPIEMKEEYYLDVM